jgi:hypothetical protein
MLSFYPTTIQLYSMYNVEHKLVSRVVAVCLYITYTVSVFFFLGFVQYSISSTPAWMLCLYLRERRSAPVLVQCCAISDFVLDRLCPWVVAVSLLLSGCYSMSMSLGGALSRAVLRCIPVFLTQMIAVSISSGRCCVSVSGYRCCVSIV